MRLLFPLSEAPLAVPFPLPERARTLPAVANGTEIRLFGEISHRPREQVDAMAVLVGLRK